jgi:adenylylsulfate kinase
MTIWFTGLSGAGKTTLCRIVYAELTQLGLNVEILDADEVRPRICPDLGYSRADRCESLLRIGYVANLLSRNRVITLVAAISPYRHIRNELRSQIERFTEVYVDADLAVCEARDPKGLYRKARAGRLSGLTGIDAPYEPPVCPEIVCHTAVESPQQSAGKVVEFVLTCCCPSVSSAINAVYDN